MRRHPYAELLDNAVDDLTSQRPFSFVPMQLAGKEPGVVAAAQARPEHCEVERQHFTQDLGKGIFQRLVVFDVLERNDEVVGRLRSANPYDISFKMERSQICKPHRSD